MAKDPAFLFYYQDFAYGTRKMTFEEKGCYIELLCEQADSGHLSINDIKRILKNSFPIWDAICSKFDIDDNGLFFNKVLESHIIKRRKFTESRKNNLNSSHMKDHMDTHMENVNENRNVNINVIKNEDKIKKHETIIPELSEFISYCKTLSIYHQSLDFQIEAKYNAWVENKWKDGNNKKIKNWKIKIQNTLPYFKKAYDGTAINKQGSRDNNGIGRNHEYIQPKESKYDYK